MPPADGSHQSFLPVAKHIMADPFVAAEVRREEARIADHKRNHVSGVQWSGMGEAPFKARDIREMLRDAEFARQRAEDFDKSPRKAFLVALKGIEQLPTYEADAERLRGIYCRDLADDRQPLNTKAVGAALTILNTIPGKDARACIDALSEMLLARTV